MRPGVLPLGRCCVKPIRRNPAQKPRLQSVTDGSLLMPVTRQEYTEVKQVHERCASSTYYRVKVPPALAVSSSSSSDYFHCASSVIASRINVTSSLTLFPHSDRARREKNFSSINATGFSVSLLSFACCVWVICNDFCWARTKMSGWIWNSGGKWNSGSRILVVSTKFLIKSTKILVLEFWNSRISVNSIKHFFPCDFIL